MYFLAALVLVCVDVMVMSSTYDGSALDFNFEWAIGGSILTAGKRLSLKNLNVTIRAIN